MVSLTDAVVSQIAGQALPLVLWIVVPLPLLELLTGQILVLWLPLRPKSEFVLKFQGRRKNVQELLIVEMRRTAGACNRNNTAGILTGFLHWAQKLFRHDGQVTFSWSPSLINPEVH